MTGCQQAFLNGRVCVCLCVFSLLNLSFSFFLFLFSLKMTSQLKKFLLSVSPISSVCNGPNSPLQTKRGLSIFLIAKWFSFFSLVLDFSSISTDLPMRRRHDGSWLQLHPLVSPGGKLALQKKRKKERTKETLLTNNVNSWA